MLRRILLGVILAGAVGARHFLVADDPGGRCRGFASCLARRISPTASQRSMPVDVPPATPCPTSPTGSSWAAGSRFLRRSGRSMSPTFRPIRPTASGGGARRISSTAVLKGTSPDGAHYFPAFPYASYQHAKVEDVRDLFAYLKTLAPVAGKARDHDVPFPFNIRRNVGIWKLLFMDGKPFVPDAVTYGAVESRRLSRQQSRPLRGMPQPAQFPRRHRRGAALRRRTQSGRRGLGTQHHPEGRIGRLERQGYRLFPGDRANA